MNELNPVAWKSRTSVTLKEQIGKVAWPSMGCPVEPLVFLFDAQAIIAVKDQEIAKAEQYIYDLTNSETGEIPTLLALLEQARDALVDENPLAYKNLLTAVNEKLGEKK